MHATMFEALYTNRARIRSCCQVERGALMRSRFASLAAMAIGR
jgi:hypothetical protein